MKHKFDLYLGLIILTFVLPSPNLIYCQNLLTFNYNNNQYNVSYNTTCSLLQSSNVPNGVKCLMLCQQTLCKSVVYDGSTNSCILRVSQPSLIKYANLTNLNLVYNLDTYFSLGQSCLFDFTCAESSCVNGVCKCMRNLTLYNYGLINEWTLNNTLLDSVQCNDLTLNGGASFVQESNSSIYSGLVPSTGYFSAPPDVYFSGDFTVTALVYVLETEYWSRLIDFGNGAASDNVLIALSMALSGQPIFVIYNNGDYQNLNIASSTAIPTNQWTHLAAVLSGSSASIYLNCTLINSKTFSLLNRNVVRNYNYIGRSSWSGDSYADAKYRNVRIYNRALNLTELFADFYNSFY